jgi:hypothetical protein
LHYVKTTELIRWEDFDFVWDTMNKYDSLGNGVTAEGFAPENFPWLRVESIPSGPKAVQHAEMRDEVKPEGAVPTAGTVY